MEVTRTVSCKLILADEQRKQLAETLRAFADACNEIVTVCTSLKSINKYKVQAACYRRIREMFGLSSNLTTRAIARVCAALKANESKQCRFVPNAMDLDSQVCSVRQSDWTASVRLLRSRERMPMSIGDWQKQLLADHLARPNVTAAVIVLRRDGEVFLNICIKTKCVQHAVSDVLGVDLGMRRIAVDSDSTVYESTEVNRIRQHYPKVRRSLQSKGTRGAKRLLKRLSGRERRHQRAINHVVSRRLVDVAKRTGRGIALEDLTGITKRCNVRKGNRYKHRSWAFFQLRRFITYKAALAGVPVVFIDPRYTSQTCHKCGERGVRSGLTFVCRNHGEFDADFNAAINIAVAGARVTEPEISECSTDKQAP